MEWNLGALITLGIALVGAIVWIIRLEGKVKILESLINGERGIFKILDRVETKLDNVSNTLIEVRQELKDLTKDHERNKQYCSNYQSNTME